MSLPHTSERGDNIAFIVGAPAMTSLSCSDARLLFAARVRTHSPDARTGKTCSTLRSHKCLKIGHNGACPMRLATVKISCWSSSWVSWGWGGNVIWVTMWRQLLLAIGANAAALSVSETADAPGRSQTRITSVRECCEKWENIEYAASLTRKMSWWCGRSKVNGCTGTNVTTLLTTLAHNVVCIAHKSNPTTDYSWNSNPTASLTTLFDNQSITNA